MSDGYLNNELESINFKLGDLVTGSVSKVEDEKIWVDFGYKSEGEISLSEWSDVKVTSLSDAVLAGEPVRAVLLSLGDENQSPNLSRKRAVDDKVFERLQEMLDRDEVFQVRILSVVKGGLVTDIEGLRAFIPASLLDLKFVEDLQPFSGKVMDVVISELDIAHRRVILSHKKVLEKTDQGKRTQRLNEFHVGDIVIGKVARITSFGGFIDLGGVDGLLHVSELSWSRVTHPEEVIHVGDEVRVKVLLVNPEEGKISLSMKTEQTDPWQLVTKKFHVGDIVKGTVQRLASFGAFVELEEGIEGLVHVSQIANHRVAHPSDALKTGDEVEVKILDIKPDEGRISLSIKEAHKAADKKTVTSWESKQEPESHGATLGELIGDVLREKFKL